MSYLLFGLLLLAGVLVIMFTLNSQASEETALSTPATETFINTWLRNDNDTLATYIKPGEELDEDLVKGREALAETLGLWMEYALEKEDETMFKEAYDQLHEYFLENDGFINWKITEEGESRISSNALIDDIRIAAALTYADAKWVDGAYLQTAEKISNYLNQHNVREGIFTDFYERKDKYASSVITLSYIDETSLNLLVQKAGLNHTAAENTIKVLREAPIENSFYPKSYNVEEKEYVFDDEINIVDQAITAYHQGAAGERSDSLLSFIKEEMAERGAVHGIYERETEAPLVDYESPAIYAYLIMYSLRIDEEGLAEEIYHRMKEFQVSKRRSDYYGGYGVTDQDTHIFDNINPLIAEEKMNTVSAEK
ncbi:glycosyl hydrolase family 8 [Alkalicoccus daliensis]|uniref:Glycosyl hydrolases family 8 n=1 Tax=Alkalicoccus daliensis TaxID=745820 RepID=A0A1H0HX34_9BACI|nr:glycosyl hydrolase family 8 [Alkalicoccus daliensis]SDO23725.1 Glycosyl hydrolases family 8 [Alkalicoccus daliensis]